MKAYIKPASEVLILQTMTMLAESNVIPIKDTNYDIEGNQETREESIFSFDVFD